jgi:LacI family transcriptional regulator
MKTSPYKVTIVEVARQAGVALGTVSRVLNNDAHVAPETRERVNAVIRDLGYVANRQARGLRNMKTNVIGVLAPDLANSYIGQILHGVDAELAVHELDLMLFTTHRAPVKEAAYVASMVQGMVDGLLLVLPRNFEDYMGTLARQNFPFTLIDHQGTGNPCPAVGTTNWQGAYSATEYLLGLGHRRIGFITGSMELGCSQERLDGYRAALCAHGLPDTPELVYEGDFRQTDGYAGASALLDLPVPPGAIFASNDLMAIGAMDAVRSRGLRIPEDVSIVGFDDIPQAAMLRPSLSTVQQPLEEMGRAATRMLLGLIKNPQEAVNRLELPTRLIIRDSTAAPGGGAFSLHPKTLTIL